MPGLHRTGNENFLPAPQLRREAHYRVCSGQAKKEISPRAPPTAPRRSLPGCTGQVTKKTSKGTTNHEHSPMNVQARSQS